MTPVVNTIEPISGKKLSYAFHEVKGELYVVLGPDSIFKTASINTDWDEDTKSAAVFKLVLKKGTNAKDVSVPETAEMVFHQAYAAWHMDESTMSSAYFYQRKDQNMARILNTPTRNKRILSINLSEDHQTIDKIIRVAKLPEHAPA